MSVLAIRTALQTQLAASLTGIDLVWENEAYTPVQGTAYAAAYLLPAQPDNPEIGPTFIDRGVFQVNLFYPLNAGSGAATTQAEAIRTAFPYGDSFVSGGVTVNIIATPEIGPARAEDDRFMVPARIRFSAFQGG